MPQSGVTAEVEVFESMALSFRTLARLVEYSAPIASLPRKCVLWVESQLEHAGRRLEYTHTSRMAL